MCALNNGGLMKLMGLVGKIAQGPSALRKLQSWTG